jgi:niacin transporter
MKGDFFMKNLSVYKMCAAALLIAIGFLIPLFSPVKFVLEPASFTLASHVSIFIAMFISPLIAVIVALGTTLGFFIAFSPVIALRAASHVIFAVLGAYYLQQHKNLINQPLQSQAFSFVIGIIHSVCEIMVVTWFYIGGSMSAGFYQQGFVRSIILLMGVGGLVHSMVDFAIALIVVKALTAQGGMTGVFAYSRENA